MWSFGCTVAELFTPKYTLFSDGADYDGLGSDLVLLGSIVSTLGTPTSETWPESMSRLKITLIPSEIVQRLEQDSAEYENCVTEKRCHALGIGTFDFLDLLHDRDFRK